MLSHSKEGIARRGNPLPQNGGYTDTKQYLSLWDCHALKGLAMTILCKLLHHCQDKQLHISVKIVPLVKIDVEYVV